jgi:hypothetical protein
MGGCGVGSGLTLPRLVPFLPTQRKFFENKVFQCFGKVSHALAPALLQEERQLVSFLMPSMP